MVSHIPQWFKCFRRLLVKARLNHRRQENEESVKSAARLFSNDGINVLKGRAFNNQDLASAKPVTIINEICTKALVNTDAARKRVRFYGPPERIRGWKL